MNQWKRKGTLLLVLLALLAVLGGVGLLAAPRAAAGPVTTQALDLSWNVVAAGGTAMSSSSYTMLSTAGQPATGQSNGANSTMLHGFWADLRSFLNELSLPVVISP